MNPKPMIKHKKIRRGKGNKGNVKSKRSCILKLFSTNGAGIVRGKIDSLKNEVNETYAKKMKKAK